MKEMRVNFDIADTMPQPFHDLFHNVGAELLSAPPVSGTECYGYIHKFRTNYSQVHA